MGIASKYNTGTTGYALQTSSSSTAYTVLATNDTQYTQTGTTNIADNTWHFAAFTYNGTTIKLYVDGIVQVTTNTIGNITHDASPFNIGARNTNGDFFNGAIDDVAIWNRSLTAQEINTSMNVGPSSVSNTNDLVGYWNFNEGSGVISCPQDFSRVTLATNCPGVSAEFTKTPKC